MFSFVIIHTRFLLLPASHAADMGFPVAIMWFFYSVLVHRPCIQCLLLLLLTFAALCFSGLPQFCILSTCPLSY